MTSKKVRYGHLYDYLRSLGYNAEPGPTYVVYRKSGAGLPVILPKTSKVSEVSLSHLAAVEQILVLDGVVAAGPLNFLTDRLPARTKAAKAKSPKIKRA